MNRITFINQTINMKQLFYFKSLLVTMLALFLCIGAYADTSTLTFTKASGGSGTADDGAVWTVTSDGNESTFDNSRGIHYGTNSAQVTYIKLTTSDIQGTISKIVVNASTASGVTAAVNVTVDGSAFGGNAQSLTASATNYTFEGSASGEIVVTVQKPSKATKALYVKSITVTYSIGTGTKDPQNSFANATENATVGVPYTVQKITTPSTGRKSYASSDESVATIDGSGNVTLKKAGETTITVTTAADDNYKEGSASYELKVAKGTPQLSFAQETVNLFVGDEYTPSLNNPTGVEVSYSIEDETIATLYDTGHLKALKGGTTTVTATSLENESYLSNTATFTLNVTEKLSAEGTYELVTDVSSLAVGDELVFVYQVSDDFAHVMGDQQSNNFKYVSVRYKEGVTDKSAITIPLEEANKATSFILEGSEGAWSFKTNNGYLCAVSTDNNYLRTTTAINNYAKATIAIEDGNATVTFLGKNTRNIIMYNSTSGSGLFSCYSNGQKSIQIYRKVPSNVPPTVTFSPASGTEVNYGTQVTITARTATSITYSVNGGEPVTVEGTSATVTINSHSIITATATNEYGTSEEVTAEYTIHAESPAFTYDPTEYEITIGDDFTAPELGKAADYDGTVTYSSDNTEVAEVDAETGAVTVKGAGTATITATGTATEHYAEATAFYTLTVKKQASSVSFAEPVVEITYGDNYDKQKATAEGFSGDLVYSSSDESVVKFHGNGVIDVLGPGTVTITATAPATETTEESSATYKLKIYEPADASEGVTEVLNEDFSSCKAEIASWGGNNQFDPIPTDLLGWETSYCQASLGYLKFGTSNNAGVATSPAFSVVGEAPLSFALAPWIANNKTENATVTVSLTNATFDNENSSIELSTKDLAQREFTTFDQYKIVGNSEAVQITFTSGGGYERFFLDNVVVGGGAQPAHEINLKFSSAGYLTWVATADIDFTQTTGVTAYKITEATPKKITMVEVDKVPKDAAVMLKGSGTVTLKRTTEEVAELSDNKMLACTDGSVTGNGVGGVTNTDVYVLGNGKNGLGFYMLKGTLQAGKGYLSVTEEAGNAKQNFIGFEVVTGLAAVEAKDADDAAIYNLQGIRVANPQKGIYVKNGKKYVIK